MPIKRESVPVRLRRDQINRLNLLRAALAEKMGKEFTLSDLVSVAVDNFLDSK
jgi:hypothetical protein